MGLDSTSQSTNKELDQFIVTKFDPLLTIVKELNDRLYLSEKENYKLEKRISHIEKHLELLTNDQNYKFSPSLESEQSDPYSPPQILEKDPSLLPPWLFSCKSGTPLSSIQALLNISNINTIELDVTSWLREEGMWLDFLEQLPKKFSPGVIESSQLQILRQHGKERHYIARRTLLDLSHGEALIVLRNVPGKHQVASQTTKITLVAILTSAVSEAFKRVESVEPQNLGRVCVVLDGDGVGSKLRAGTKRFKIEPLN